MQSKGWGLRVSRARESSRRSLLCIFPLESKARSYTAPHFCTYIYTYIQQHEEHAFIFYSDDGKKEAENLFSSRIQLSAMHTHTTHPTYPTGLSYLYTASTLAPREGRSRRVAARAERRARETHTRAKSILPSFAQTHTTQGSWFLAKMAWQGQLTLALPFSLLNSLEGDFANTTKHCLRPYL
jgi:hypothetical protein